MKKYSIKKGKKESKEIFKNEELNSTISENYNPLKVNYKIYKTGNGLLSMKNEELNKTKFVDFIDEESYQHIKKNMCKKDDYFTEKEFEKIDVILT